MIYLIFSWLLINFVHGYGVYINRRKPFDTISENVTATPTSLLFYRVAHGINGVLLLLIVSQVGGKNASMAILVLTGLSIMFEWGQATVPYKKQWKALHSILALSMAMSMVLLGWVLLISSQLYGVKMLIAIIAGVIAVLSMFYYKNPPRSKSWIIQMITINTLYLQLAMILYGRNVL